MVFETGKYYKHTTGVYMFICGETDTLLYGHCLIGEVSCGERFIPVGMGEDNAANWVEVPESEGKPQLVECTSENDTKEAD